MNRFTFNGGAPVNQGLSTAVASVGSPADQTYRVDTLAKTSFPSFVAFATNPIDLVDVVEPTNTTIRFAFRFANGGDIKTFTGTDWQPLSGDGATNGMTASSVESLTAANMIATGGFDSGTPWLQPIIYLRTTDISVAPSISGVTISFIQGTGAFVVWANHFTSDVPVAGTTDIPQGTYIWDVNSGFRLEDGVTDNNNSIEYEFETQDFMVENSRKSYFYEVEIDVESSVAGQTFTVTPITDGEDQPSRTITTIQGRKLYYAGVQKSDAGLTHRFRVAWTGNNLVFHKFGLIHEPTGATKP